MIKLEKKIETTNVKRRLASEEGCLIDLKVELPMLFEAFEEASENYNNEIVMTPPEARCRGFEASLFNSKLIQSIQKFFPWNWKYGKYKSFILNSNGYLILFKKLDNKGMPMNIRTKIVESINSQRMGSLFDEFVSIESPILYFGYKKNRLGTISQPQLVYIDENQVRWTIEENVCFMNNSVYMEKPSKMTVAPKLRNTIKKAVNE